jgi:hypothetical protein
MDGWVDRQKQINIPVHVPKYQSIFAEKISLIHKSSSQMKVELRPHMNTIK